MSFKPKNASKPPKVGEYVYYDSRINNKYYDNEHYLINTKSKNNVGCYYSLDHEIKNKPFITCHGIIIEVIAKT